MAKIHMILQGKGGVGKSFIAAVLAQYKLSKGQKPLCINTDPVNSTFFGFKGLNVRRLHILDGDEINSRNFDTLVELIAPSKDDYIIDTGASSFVPLSRYLISNQVPALLQEMGHELVVDTVITGQSSTARYGERLRAVGETVPERSMVRGLAQSVLGTDRA